MDIKMAEMDKKLSKINEYLRIFDDRMLNECITPETFREKLEGILQAVLE